MNKLRIALVNRVWESVPPKAYGGTELIVESLANGLIKLGHDVTLFAPGDCKTDAKLDSIVDTRMASLDSPTQNDQSFTELANSKNCFDRAHDFDVIHLHNGIFSLPYVDSCETPCVSTLHTLIRPNQEPMFKMTKKAHFISISKYFQKVCGQVDYQDVVYNGINLDQFDLNMNPSDHLIHIGRICPDKGFIEAVNIAKKAKMKLKIAGPDPEKYDEANPWICDLEYFKKLQNSLDDEREYIGEVEHDQKSEFFGSAKALIFPLQWDEPFGLVVAEAMACGTPVIAYDRGSMNELIEDGVTGFVVPFNDEEAMIKAIEKIDTIDRRKCRERAENLFGQEKMIDNYLKVYQDSISSKQ